MLVIAFFRHSFTEASISGVITLKQANISRFGLWLVQVAQGLIRVRKLRFIGLMFGVGCPVQRKESLLLSQAIISQANIYVSLN